jgi:hypothetical protein
MLQPPPHVSLVPHEVAIVRLLTCPHMVLLCGFCFIPCCAPVHAGGHHPRSALFLAACPCMKVGTTHTCAPPRFAYVVRARGYACRWGPDLHLTTDLFLQHSDKTHVTFRWNIWNRHLKRMKHIMPANENTCNMKHLLQRTSEIGETFETYGWSICV